MRIDRGERIREAWCRAMDNEAIHDDEERGKVPSTAEKVTGGIEMAAGVAIAAAGVPMMVLPGPGAAAAKAGGRLAGKGLDAAAVAYLRHREQKRGDAL